MLGNTFSERLQQARKKAGLTQQQLSELIGAKRKQVVNNWEKNVAEPSFEMLLKLSQVLGVSVDWLLGNSAGLLKGLDDPEQIEHFSQYPTAQAGEWALPEDGNDESAGDINHENSLIYTAHIRKFMQDMHISPDFADDFEAYVGYLRYRSKQS